MKKDIKEDFMSFIGKAIKLKLAQKGLNYLKRRKAKKK
jgi:hypothetical protein